MVPVVVRRRGASSGQHDIDRLSGLFKGRRSGMAAPNCVASQAVRLTDIPANHQDSMASIFSRA